MKVCVIYYDGNDTKARFVSLDDSDHPSDVTLLGLGLSGDDMLTAVVQVPDDLEYLYQSPSSDGMSIVVTLDKDDHSTKVLDLEEE